MAGRGSALQREASKGNTGRTSPGRTTARPGLEAGAMGDPLTIKVHHEQDYVIVTAAGEIDISTVTRMRECLFDLAASGRPLVADLDQVSFIDSTGLAALVGTAKRATCRGGGLYAVCGRPKIRQLFRLTGLDSRIPLFSTLAEALEALAAGRATS